VVPPSGTVREYVAAGHAVIVETGAGFGIGADDDAYRRTGAVIADTGAARHFSMGWLWRTADSPPLRTIASAGGTEHSRRRRDLQACRRPSRVAVQFTRGHPASLLKNAISSRKMC
jgi:hypothetical protein